MATAASPADRFPPQIKYIIGNEAAERFSFYGMRNILTVFLIDYLLKNVVPDSASREAVAKSNFHLFVMAVYFFPLLGGYLADRYWGKFRTIFWLSLLYCMGHACLALFDHSREGFYVGLFLIALGSGGIKPCISSFVGDQFTEGNKHLVKKVFALFYWSVNFGSFFASLLIPKTLEKFGPSVAFGIPGVLMAIATLIFWLGRSYYSDVPPTGANPHAFLKVVASAVRHRSGKGGHWLDAAAPEHPPEAIEGTKAVFRVLSIFAMIPFFWALFDQKASTWVVQGRSMDLMIAGFRFAPSQMQFVNPLLVMLLIPFNVGVVYPAFERWGLPLTPLRRMGVGMAVTGVSFILAGLIQVALDGGNRLSIVWQLGPYLVLTLGEVLVSTTGLEFAYSQAPRQMKGTIMSFWLLTTTLGNFLVAVVARLNVFKGPAQFFFYAGLIFLAVILYTLIARRYQPRDFFHANPAPSPDRGQAPFPQPATE